MFKKLMSLVLILSLCIPAATAASAAEAPSVGGTSAIIMDATTGEVLWSKNADQVRAVASMTKVMAAYLVLDAVNSGQISMDTPVPISTYTYYFSRDSRYSNIPFDYDKTYTVEDMLEAFMCYSACAAGPALGELVYGSEDAFVDAMNAKAQEMGIEASFTESYDSGRLSAASMAKLAQKIVNECPQILDIAQRSSFEFGGRTYSTSNELLQGDWEGVGEVDGLKTGWSPSAGSCMVATSTKDGSRLITVTMNAPTVRGRITDSAELLRYGFEVLGDKKAEGYTYASPHTATVSLNGGQVSMQAYLADGNNYVRLRDFANIINGTGSQFSLEYDSNQHAVVIQTGSAYAPSGSEGQATGTETVFTKLTQPVLYVDGESYEINSYLIGGLNYMKVRDLAAAIGCGIEWDSTTGRVVLIPNESADTTANSSVEDGTAADDNTVNSDETVVTDDANVAAVDEEIYSVEENIAA
ncbi:MAG: D-alanyl-D-alanine carboxypeptidase family protein [Peptococcaceae bacterium]|nr:D-alanyl-D-alanine carboxypeptidase family protein [Peptococcaceae bacterium]